MNEDKVKAEMLSIRQSIRRIDKHIGILYKERKMLKERRDLIQKHINEYRKNNV